MASTTFILGATGGIGSELCRRLSAKGVPLALAGRREKPLRELAEELGATYYLVDGSSVVTIQAAIERAAEEAGGLGGLVNCAGSILLRPAHRTSEAEWRDTLNANLDSAFAVVSAGAKVMLREGGSIVLVSSAAARLGLPNHEAVAAAKAGVIGLALSAAATYAPRGIRVNAVAPGLVRTPLAADVLKSSEKVSIAMHPLGRLGEPADVARAIEWLLDPVQSWVTGQVLGVDGGLGTLRSR